jgi:hypothetical protein
VSGITCTDLSEMTALKKRKDCTIQTEYSKSVIDALLPPRIYSQRLVLDKRGF